MQLLARLAAILLMASTLVAQSPKRSGDYLFVPFEKPGASGTTLTSINDLGQMTGTYTEAGVTRQFVYRGGEFDVVDVAELIPGLDYEPSLFIRAVNNSGTYVGFVQGHPAYTITGFSVDRGNFALVMPPGGAALSWANGINNVGQIVGTTNTPVGDSASFLGFLRNADGTYDIIDPCHETYLTNSPCYSFWVIELKGINDKGTIVGSRIFQVDLNADALVFRNGRFRYFKHPAIENSTGVTKFNAINNHGAIVGTFQDTTDQSRPAPVHGFVFHGGQFAALEYPGALETEPASINSFGTVVGWARLPGSKTIGFIAVPAKNIKRP